MTSKLGKRIKTVDKVFNTQKLISEQQDIASIKKYYLQNYLAYLIFHNTHGFMHMGISYDSRYKYRDLLEPLKITDSYINKTKKEKVLELGAGNGSNCLYLSKRHKNTQFLGIDLSEPKATGMKDASNYRQEVGDFHDLDIYENGSLDLIFTIEALCHSTNRDKVLNEAYKKLKDGGYFLIFDGYLNKEARNLTEIEKKAKQLTQKAMAVETFDEIETFRQKIARSGFKIVKERNLSKNILPSLQRFERLAGIFYAIPPVTRLIKFLLPNEVTQNSIAGLLMPTLIQEGIACYYLHVLQKPNSK